MILVAAQSLHSVEEYLFRLYETFPPARFLSSLVASDVQTGFLVLNALLVGFGIWCYAYPVRREWRFALPLMWTWVVVEAVNGLVHPVWSVMQRAYTPGLITSLALLPLALFVARRLSAANYVAA